ncbi:MAG TPA: MBL fold metallo-hydrolase [Dehalococcoidales bacterium]|nr:MBL fold metallo-hydrolase [Dehalococcoidales bacterium]
MQIRLSFLGAAQNVTGSKYLLETDNVKLLVDCGLYQERELKGRNWNPFFMPPQSLGAVLLTHAHLDHCGLLPRLVLKDFNQPIYCTAATAEITRIMLLDAGKLQEEDAEFKQRRHKKERRKGKYPEIPLYTQEDAEAVFPLFSPVKYGEPVPIGEGVEASFHDAGHVLGSSMVRLKVKQNGEQRIVIFSGDIGRWRKPMLEDPTLFDEADYVVVESTYGDRLLEPVEDTAKEFAEIINATATKGGNIIIPSFALERSQEILYYLNKFRLEKRIPHLPVFVDSPMAISITEVFGNYPQLFDGEMKKLLSQEKSPFAFPELKMVRTTEESKELNKLTGSNIIIAGSGMCTGGRIKHHLVNNITREENTILFVGYQAFGTLGRYIVDGAKTARILGNYYPIRARIAQVHGFSAHADRDELIKWLSGLAKPPRRVFITHGELKASKNLAGLVRESKGWETLIPRYRQQVLLD